MKACPSIQWSLAPPTVPQPLSILLFVYILLCLNSSLRLRLGHAFPPKWLQNLYWTQAQHLCFFMILFGLFDLILLFDCQICHVNCETESWKKKKFILKKYHQIVLSNNPQQSAKTSQMTERASVEIAIQSYLYDCSVLIKLS